MKLLEDIHFRVINSPRVNLYDVGGLPRVIVKQFIFNSKKRIFPQKCNIKNDFVRNYFAIYYLLRCDINNYLP